jgi:hypothetical protein
MTPPYKTCKRTTTHAIVKDIYFKTHMVVRYDPLARKLVNDDSLAKVLKYACKKKAFNKIIDLILDYNCETLEEVKECAKINDINLNFKIYAKTVNFSQCQLAV